MQVPGAGPKLLQFSEMGKHWSRLAAKNAMVHIIVRAIITHDVMENVLVAKILKRTLASSKRSRSNMIETGYLR